MIIQKFVYSFLSFFIFSFLVSDSIFFIIFLDIKIYITDIIFVFLFLFILIKYNIKFISFIFNIKKLFFLEKLILIILLLKFLKYCMDYENLYNFTEFIKYFYVLFIYTTFKFIILSEKKYELFIINNFIYIFFISSIILFISFILYYFQINLLNVNLWEIKNVSYPYFGKSIIHFNGLLNHYNMQAYIMIPGFFFYIIRNYSNKIHLYLFSLLLFCLILFLMKSKIILLVFSITIIFFIFYKYRNLKNINILFLFSLILIFIMYFLVTHFLLLRNTDINPENFHNFSTYYTSHPLISFYDYNIHGSLFYKLKLVSYEHAKSYNFIVFDSNNFNNFFKLFSQTKDIDFSGITSLDPHSEHFSFLSDFGLIGFTLINIFLLYPIIKVFILSNIDDININFYAVIVSLIVFDIEAINSDITHLRFFWILLAFFYMYIYQKRKIFS